MRLDSLPRSVLQSVVELGELAEGFRLHADDLASRVDTLRRVINGQTEVGKQQFAEANRAFPAALEAARAAKLRADAATHTVTAVKNWIGALDHHAKLVPITPPRPVGQFLERCRRRLAEIASEIAAIKAAPEPIDLQPRVAAFVANLAKQAAPTLTGKPLGPDAYVYAIDVNNSLTFAPQCPPLAVLAWLAPERLAQAICAAVTEQASRPLPPEQRPARVAALHEERAKLRLVEEVLVRQAIDAGDPTVVRQLDAPVEAILMIKLQPGKPQQLEAAE
jgi:hypothetical protein